MKAKVDFCTVKPHGLKKLDYIVLNDDSLAKIIKVIDEDVFNIFIPGSSVEQQYRKNISIEEIKHKLELWAFIDDKKIAKISDKCTFVRQGEIIEGWIRKDYFSPDNYNKVFMVKCKCCKRSC